MRRHGGSPRAGSHRSRRPATLRRGQMSDPSFERDILPLFRSEDIDAMAFAFDLASHAEVSENAEEIHARLADGTMPCDAAWPAEDVARFRSWIDAGMPA